MATAYGDRSTVREALRLLAEILTQGRAADCSVMAFVQEPSKDVVEVRDLFTTKICLGVTTAVHVDMALGDGARDKGALADEIPGDEAHAGIGFAIAPGSRLPVRLRAGLVTDRDIAELVATCAPGTDVSAAEERRWRHRARYAPDRPPHPTRQRIRHGQHRRHDRRGERVITTTRHYAIGRNREATAITTSLAVPCGLACSGSVIPGLDDLITTVLVGLAALALVTLVARWVARWVRERRQDAADALTAAHWRAPQAADSAHPSRPRPPQHPPAGTRARRSGGGVMWGVTGWVIRDLAPHHHPARARGGRRLAMAHPRAGSPSP